MVQSTQHVRPNPDKPIKVGIDLRINEIEDVSAEGLSVRYHLQFTLRWRDERVQTTSAFGVTDSREIVQRVMDPKRMEVSRSMDTDFLNYLWVPDITIYNLKQLATLEMVRPQTSLRIYKNSTIEYRFSARLTVGCSFFFSNYPIDKQVCDFLVGSSSLTKDEMIFQGSFYHPMETQRPLPVDYELVRLPVDERIRPRVEKEGQAPKNYSVTGFKMRMTSLFANIVIQTYVPSGLFGYVSFVSFLIRRKEQTGRLIMLVLLTLLEVNVLANLKVPPSNGTTAVQIYCLACLVCVVCALMEYAITICDQSPAVSTFQKLTRKAIRSRRKERHEDARGNSGGNQKDQKAKRESKMVKLERAGRKCFHPEYLDMCAFSLFPIVFTAFNIGYWAYFLTEQNKQQ